MGKLYVLVLVAALAACGKSQTERKVVVTNEDGTQTTATVKSDGEATTIKSDKGTITVNAGSDGAEFPAYAPQYPGAKVTSVMSGGSEGEGKGSVIGMETPDDPAKVLAFYKDKLKANNVTVKMETTTPEGGMIAAGDTDKQGVLITVSKAGDKTSVAIMAGSSGR